MKIAIYSRKSKFTGRGESIENQIEICKQYITNYIESEEKIQLFLYEDEGISGATLMRPHFQQMMADAIEMKFDYVVCYRLDRISRDVGDFSALLHQLNENKIAFVSVREQFDTSSPMGRAMMYVASVFAQLERETIAERVRDNMLLLARSGHWLGGKTPTGFVSARKDQWVNGVKKSVCVLEPVEAEMEKIKIIYEQFLKCGSVAAVERYCRQNGMYGREGKLLTRQGLKEILCNPVYCVADEAAKMYFNEKGCSQVFFIGKGKGCIAYNKRNYNKKHFPRQDKTQWIIAEGDHDGVIKGEDWVIVQKKLEQNSAKAERKNQKNTYALLSGNIICVKCGKPMFAKKRHSGHNFDYICSTKLKWGREGCDMKNLMGIETDQAFCQKIRNYFVEDKGVFRQELEQWRNKLKMNRDELFLEKAIEQCEIKQEQLLAVLQQKKLNDLLIQQINQKAIELEEEKQHLIRLQKEKKEKPIQDVAFFVRENIDFAVLFDKLEIEEKRQAISYILEDISWNGEQLHIGVKSKP